MTAALGAAAATVASALARPGPASATNNGSVLLGNSPVGTVDGTGINEATSTTRVVTTSGTGLAGESHSTSGRGVTGHAVADDGVTYGVYGRCDSPWGAGIRGLASATYGPADGVQGESASDGGRGVVGFASAATGATYGVYGRSTSPQGRGVFGWAEAETGWPIGVAGQAGSSSGIGVQGLAGSLAGPTTGVLGVVYSPDGIGVHGWGKATSGPMVGLLGESTSPSGTGVLGFVGQHDEIPAVSPETGVYGHATQHSWARGVYGRSASGRGVYGQATSGQGVRGYATTGTAGYFASAKPASLHIGLALRAIGRVKLDQCAGVATILSGSKTVLVAPGIDLVPTSAVTATLLGSAGGMTTVHRVAVNTTANTFTIFLTANSSADVKVAWHVFG